MIVYILKRLASIALTFTVVSVIVFLMMHAVPGGPFDGNDMPVSDEVKAKLNASLGLDRPLYVQCFKYMWGVLHFDFGVPFQSPGETVLELLGRAWPPSLILGGAGVLIVVFAVWLDWLPASGWGKPYSWVLPIVAYATITLATYARYTRSAMLDVLNKPFVTVLRAKGLSERRIIFQHVLRNAALPMVTVFLPMFIGTATGSIFVEAMFRVPGLGAYFVSSINLRDYALEMALILMITMMFCVSYLISDILYALLNPRIRTGGRRG